MDLHGFREKFTQLSRKLLNTKVNLGSEGELQISKVIEELNAIDYKVKFLTDADVSPVLVKCCSTVSVSNDLLLRQLCVLTFNVLCRQQLVLTINVESVVTYFIHASKQCPTTLKADVIRALGAVLFMNGYKTANLIQTLLDDQSLLSDAVLSTDEKLRRASVQCIESFSARAADGSSLPPELILKCISLLLHVLQSSKLATMDNFTDYRFRLSALRAIQNFAEVKLDLPVDLLGPLLAILKVYAPLGLPGHMSATDAFAEVSKVMTDEHLLMNYSGVGSPSLEDTALTASNVSGPLADALNNFGLTDARPQSNELSGESVNETSLAVDNSDNSGAVDSQRAVNRPIEDGQAAAAVKADLKDADDAICLRPGGATSMSKISRGSGRVATGRGGGGGQTSGSSESRSDGWGRDRSRGNRQRGGRGGRSQGGHETKGRQAEHRRGGGGGARGSRGGRRSGEQDDDDDEEATESQQGGLDQSLLGSLLDWNSTSESDQSDVEGGTQAGHVKSQLARIRHTALSSLYHVIKGTNKKTMFSHWRILLPFSSEPSVIFTSATKEPSIKMRTLALLILSTLLESSKQFLLAAEESDQYRSAPFTPFSVQLGHMIKEVHRCLLLALVSENSALTLTQIIKCLALVIPNVPYGRLKPGLLTRITKQIRPFFAHRDPNIRVACLTCLGSVLSVPASEVEIAHILNSMRASTRFSLSSSLDLPPSTTSSLRPQRAGQNQSSVSDIPTPHLSSGTQTPSLSFGLQQAEDGRLPQEQPWIVSLCSTNVQQPTSAGATQPLPVRLESLQLLAHLCKHHFNYVRQSLPQLQSLIRFCLSEDNASLQLHGLKLLVEIGERLLHQKEDCLFTPDEVQQFWVPLLGGPLPAAMQNSTNPSVCMTACDCFACIGGDTFEKLARERQIVCMTLLLGMMGHEDSRVRAAAIRALGFFIVYPCLRQDIAFVADTANAIIRCLSENTLPVRVKAAWSLGNLSDALVLNKNSGDTSLTDDFADVLLLKLFDVCVSSATDNDKVRANVVRALGNFLAYLPERCFKNSRFADAVKRSMKTLAASCSGGSMKVRWNSCYAMGNMFRNKSLYGPGASVIGDVYGALVAAVTKSKNFKVRINGAVALSVPVERGMYAEHYTMVWNQLLTALVTAESVDDFSEFKYRDSLMQQLTTTIEHLLTLALESDVVVLDKVLVEELSANQHLARVISYSEWTKAREHLQNISTNASATTKQAVQHLLATLTAKQEAAAASHGAFRQTYD